MKTKRQYKVKRMYTELGEELQRLRIKRGLTQREVGETLGYSSAQFISNFERGISMPPIKKLKVLAEMYQLPRGRMAKLVLIGTQKKVLEALYN